MAAFSNNDSISKCNHCKSSRYFKQLKVDFLQSVQINVVNVHCQGCGLEIHYKLEELPFNYTREQLKIFDDLKKRCAVLPQYSECMLQHGHFSGSRKVDSNLDTGIKGESYSVKCIVCQKLISHRELSPFPYFSRPYAPNGPVRFKYTCTVHFSV